MKRIDMKTIAVTFEGNNIHSHYYCPFEVSVGDKVIVDSPRNGYVAVTVEDSDSKPSGKTTKRVVCTIDDSEYVSWKETEDKKKKLLAKLEERRKAVEEVAIYRMLAEQDEEARELFKELDSL